MLVQQDVRPWTIEDAVELYDVERWGKGYFTVNAAGNVCACPTKDPSRVIDLKKLVDRLAARGIDPPILVRFGELLKHRLAEIHGAFAQAMQEHSYRGRYCCIYPIKVNQ